MSNYSDYVLNMATPPSSFWPCNGTSDLALENISLTLVGSPTLVPSIVPNDAGATNQAFALSAGNYFHAGDVYDMNGLDFTFMFWLKLTSTTFGSGFQRLINKRNASAPNEGYLFYGQGTNNTSWDWDFGADADGVGLATGFRQDQVHHIGITFTQSTAGLGITLDGQFLGLETVWDFGPPWNVSVAGNLVFGANESGVNNFIGVLDDIAVWEGTALTSSEIARAYQAGAQQTTYYSRRIMVSR